MIPPDAVAAGIRIVRAEEAWEPVIFGGMIPVLGAGAVFWLIRYAVKEPPEESEQQPFEGGPREGENGGGSGDPDPPSP